LTAPAEKLTGDLKDACTVATDDLLKSILVALTRSQYQIVVGNFCNDL
jgi:hypothetical protein